jgi:hypothetical protein
VNFGRAIEELKGGKLVRRAGWNGKGMYLYLHPVTSCLVPEVPPRSVFNVVAEREARDGVQPNWINLEPCVVMRTAQAKHQPGWLASQADVLGEDWEVVE